MIAQVAPAARAQRAVEAVVDREAVRVDRERLFPDVSLAALREEGLLALMIPGEMGGEGGGAVELCNVCVVIGSACASTAMVFLMHSVSTAALVQGGGPTSDSTLGLVAGGNGLTSLAFSERATGSHFYMPQTTARKNAGRVVLDGRKAFVTSGGHADAYLVLAQSATFEGQLDAYVIGPRDPGVRFEGQWDGLGLAGNSSVSMILDGADVSVDALVGEPGNANGLVFGTVAPLFLVGVAAINVGIALAAARAALTHVVSRRYSEASGLADVQYVQHLLAEMDTEARAAGLLAQEAARLVEARTGDALLVAMQAKVAATEAAASVTEGALLATGGQGYTPSLSIERHLRDARAGAVMAPTNAVLRSWIGKALAGLEIP